MLVSKKQGTKYGLIQPKQKQAAKPIQPSLAVFGEEEEAADGPKDGVARSIARQADKKRADAKVAAQQAAALAEDPTAFDYDSVYDDLQQKRAQPKQAEKLARKSRYIEGLLDKAKEREREQDIVYERRLAKERQAEDHLFGDKDAFVTSAYKKKLQEDQKWLAEEKVREELEKRDDVVKKGHMGDFYGNLMRNNVAFGTASERPKPSAPSSQPDAASPSAAAAAADPSREAGAAAVADRQQPSAAAVKPAQTEAETVLSDSAAAFPSDALQQAGRDRTQSAAAVQVQQSKSGADDGARSAAESAVTNQQAAPDEAKPEPPSREEKLTSARDRYLARKRKGPDS